jgi:hypothetical protein
VRRNGLSRRLALAAGLGYALVTVAWTVAGPTADHKSADQVTSIDLPYEEPPRVPAGPNQAAFVAYCRLCHSPRLALTQPRFTEKKWGEIVHKMVATYGAEIPPEMEPAVVKYLVAVQKPTK